KENRNEFEKAISEILNQNGSVFITCPTILHQNYLRANFPKGLQPVDEDITLSIINEFAEMIDGEVTYFEYKNIWHTNDYFHCLISKGPDYKIKQENSYDFNLEKRSKRAKRVIDSEFKKYF